MVSTSQFAWFKDFCCTGCLSHYQTNEKSLGDYKVICLVDDDCLWKIEYQYIGHLNAVQADLGFSLTNKLKKKHFGWQKYKMKVSIAAQTLSASVAHALDVLRVDICREQANIRFHKES